MITVADIQKDLPDWPPNVIEPLLGPMQKPAPKQPDEPQSY
jgi:hypothetical protein